MATSSTLDIASIEGTGAARLEHFALLNLGMVQSLASGTMSASEATDEFYNGSNCLFVRKQMNNKLADEIMAHGVQLPDLFEALSPEEAQRELYLELEKMKRLALELLQQARGERMETEP